MERPQVVIIALVFVLIGGLLFAAPHFTTTEYVRGVVDDVLPDAATPKESAEPDNRPVVAHQPLPEEVRAIYMTSCVAGTPSFREELIALMERTEVNAVMIDIKDFSGTISFPPSYESWQPAWEAARCGTADMRELIAELHDKDIFVIGRITVFQDPFYTKTHPELAVKRSDRTTVWEDHKGLSFIDVAAKPYWEHIVDLAVDSYNLGFDELNFDYVRYPSDGNMQDIAFVLSEEGEYGLDKQANLEAFFSFLHAEMNNEERFAAYRHETTGRDKAVPWTSADLFGMTTTNYDDLSIGQVQDRAAPYFDFIAPMVYPSHYPDGSFGYGDPNDYPYEIVYYAMKTGADRMRASTTPMEGFLHERVGTSTPAVYKKPVFTASKLRTWIQDFDYGGDYDAADVRAQIQASYDAGVKDWMIWAPSNRYTESALKPAE